MPIFKILEFDSVPALILDAIAEIAFYDSYAPHRFAEEIRKRISSPVFLLLVWEKSQADLRIGIPR